ncbi:hypothetical protein Lser_V15G01812 [Lactuca serriola]
MSKKRTINSFFKRVEDVCDPQLHPVSDNTKEDVHNAPPQSDKNCNIKEPNSIETEKIDMSDLGEVKFDSLIRDPGERPSILSYTKFLASYNKTVANVVLENAPQNAKSTSPDIQKEILCVLATNVQKEIRDEIRMSKFCLIVDESQDESKKEQMAIVVRFVDEDGNVKERFLDLVHVKDKTSLTLKNEILSYLSYHKLSVQDIRGQGYDGDSNMCGEWNGLKALLLKECSYAYYIPCFAHQMQLALVVSSKDVFEVHNFFETLNFVVNVIYSSSKRNDQLQDAQIVEISHLVEVGELESGKGTNQIQTLQRPRDTRWSSHFKSICSWMRLFGPSCAVLHDIAIKGSTSCQRGDAEYALTHALSFDFIIVMHMMKDLMGIIYKLCQSLQQEPIDIVNALALVSITKVLIQQLIDEVWQSRLDQVVCFCEKNSIPVPNMNENNRYVIHQRCEKDNITTEHHYQVELFIVAIDSQLQELNYKFNESATELLRL